MEDKATSSQKLKYLSEHKDFSSFIDFTAGKLNLLSVVIEKDYWVTRILRELVISEFRDEFIFKGGTCLSKGYDLIERFSEDIDLLLIDNNLSSPMSNNAKKRRLEALRDYVSNLSEFTLDQDKSRIYKLNGELIYNYPRFSKQQMPETIAGSIKLEPGYRGGSWPSTVKKITSLLANVIVESGNVDIAEELEPFEIKVLGLERIFVEKLVAIQSYFKKEQLHLRTRHYYDVYKLIQTEEVNALISNRTLFVEILKDISDVSREYFKSDSEVKMDALIQCEAFNPMYEGIEEFSQGYRNDKDFYYADVPDFKEMLISINAFLKSF